MYSPELLYKLTQKTSSFRRTNLKSHFTGDPFSLSNTCRRRDAGFLLNNASALNVLEGSDKVRKIRKNTKRVKCSKKNRKGVKKVTFSTTEVDVNKVKNGCPLVARRAARLR